MLQKNRQKSRGFTLIELLVVVAIIALLISILIPSLASAKRLAKSSVCAANLHGLGNLAATYESEWDGALIGAPSTSGSALWDPNSAAIPAGQGGALSQTCPQITSPFDWMVPMCTIQGFTVTANCTPANNTATDRAYRYQAAATNKSFICPANQLVAVPYDQTVGSPAYGNVIPNFSSMQAQSYVMSTTFLLKAAGGSGAGKVRESIFASQPDYGLAASSTPRLNAVGTLANKIRMGDGTYAFNSGSKTAPAYVVQNSVSYTTNAAGTTGIGYSGSGQSFCYSGPYNQGNGASNKFFGGVWIRAAVPGNTTGVTFPYDPRSLSWRHGTGADFASGSSDAFKGNFLMFDGHAELMNDLASADPNLWVPTGTNFSGGYNYWTLWPDVINTYFGGTAPAAGAWTAN